MFCGKPSYGHFNSAKGSGVAVLFALTGMLLLLISISSLIWHMSVIASIMFISASLAVAFAVYKHHNAVRVYADNVSAKDAA